MMYSKIIFSLLFLSMIITINAQCKCGTYLGNHCGVRASDGSKYLSGECGSVTLYYCPAANFPATEKANCQYCATPGVAGTDHCAIGRIS